MRPLGPMDSFAHLDHHSHRKAREEHKDQRGPKELRARDGHDHQRDEVDKVWHGYIASAYSRSMLSALAMRVPGVVRSRHASPTV
jgi:ABC-type Zn2+ transport system substrate-binding protein/surface adhesin